MSQILNDIEKSCNPDEVLVDCGFWDFAGQRQYYPTHPIFLNPNAVHLLVSNIMKDIKQINTDEGFDKIGEYLDFWFDSIHSCRNVENKAENSREYLHPPVIIVGTRIDMCKDNLEERKNEFCRQLMTMLDHEDKKKHLRRICWVSNTEPTDKDIDCLRQTIFEIGKEIQSFKEQLPLRWIQLERLLDITREAGVNILSWLDFTSLSSKCSIDDENEIKLFLKYQHKIGTIIYFESLQDNIILNQKWLADAFKCFVSDKFDNNIMLTSGWKTLQDTGKLEPELIKKLFQKEPQLEFDKHQSHLLNLMELFGIIVKLRTLSEDGQMLCSATYYIPCIISKKASIGKINDMFNVNSHECTSTPWLCIQFNFMPLDFFNHILCYYISQYPICIEPSTKREAIYHGMGVFYLDNTRYRKFIVCFSKNTIAIQIRHWKTIEQTKYKEIMEELMSVILRIKDKYEPRRVSYCIKLKCPKGDLKNLGGRLSYKELAALRDKDYFCEDHNKCHSTTDFFQTWFADYSESSSMILDLLKEDCYEHYELRLMLVGEQGTGKSTIARFLVGAGPAIFRKSTDGIVLYTGLSFFDDETNEWLNGKQGFTIEDITASMAIRSIKTHEPSIESLIKHDDYSKIIKSSVAKKTFLNKLRDVIKKKLHYKNVVPVTIWDFRGGDLFYSTHQIFLTYSTVYILVLDGSRTLNERSHWNIFLPGRDVARTQKDYLRWWIRTILFYCRGEIPGIPKIMVILTHKDKLKVTEIEKRRDEIFGEIGEMFEDTIKQHLAIEDKLFVNARNNNDPEMQQIKHSLIRQAKNQPTWGEKLPKCFIPLELEIQFLVKKGFTIINIEDMKKINNQQAVCPLTDCELKAFLKFQHSVGKILYFNVPYLDMHIIISPTFLIDAFESIITDKQFWQGDKQKEEAWYSMGKKGIILKQTVATIWKQKKYIRFFSNMTYLLGVMTHLHILVESNRYDTNHCRIPTEFYYVPSMLRKQDTTGYRSSRTFSQRNIALCFLTSSSIIPPDFSFRFISYCLSIWGVKTYGDDNEEMFFHKSAVFTIDPLLDLYIKCEYERVIVRLVHARSRSLIMKDLASSIRECLFAALHKISQLYIKTSSGTAENVRLFDVRVCCSSSEDPCSIEIQDISDVWICSGHKIEHGKDLVLSWFTEKKKEKCESFCPVTDPDFLIQTPTALHLRRLALAYDTTEVKELVMALGLPSDKWDYLRTYLDDEALRFIALEKCFEMKFFTFENMKAAAQSAKNLNLHTFCKVLGDEHVNFDREPEKWSLVVTDEDIDKLSPLVGQYSLRFLVELGLTFSDWEQMEYGQKENDLVKLNRNIMEVWRNHCKAHNVKPVLRTLGQAFGNIGINIKIIENILFN